MCEDYKTSDEIAGEVIIDRLRKNGVLTLACRACGKEILFLKTKTGALIPVNLDLTCHYIDCTDGARFRKRITKN